MTTPILLIGFIAELNGNEGHLVIAEPVVRVGDADYVAHGSDWNVESLRPLADEERSYIRTLKAEVQVPIAPGDLVWVAGPNLVADIAALAALRDFSLEVQFNWHKYARGYKWRIGTSRQFLDLKSRSANQLELLLHRCLFDHLEKSHGDGKRLFELYSAMDTSPSRNRLINRGLYYLEDDDMYGLTMSQERGVRSGLFKDVEDFTRSVDEVRDRLRRPKLSAVPSGQIRTSRALIVELAAAKRLSQLAFYRAYKGSDMSIHDFQWHDVVVAPLSDNGSLHRVEMIERANK